MILLAGGILAAAGVIGYVAYENSLNNNLGSSGGGSTSGGGTIYVIPAPQPTAPTGSNAPIINFPSAPSYTPTYSPQPAVNTGGGGGRRTIPNANTLGSFSYQNLTGSVLTPQGSNTLVTGVAPGNIPVGYTVANNSAGQPTTQLTSGLFSPISLSGSNPFSTPFSSISNNKASPAISPANSNGTLPHSPLPAGYKV